MRKSCLHKFYVPHNAVFCFKQISPFRKTRNVIFAPSLVSAFRGSVFLEKVSVPQFAESRFAFRQLSAPRGNVFYDKKNHTEPVHVIITSGRCGRRLSPQKG
jgi:hypothetical protein